MEKLYNITVLDVEHSDILKTEIKTLKVSFQNSIKQDDFGEVIREVVSEVIKEGFERCGDDGRVGLEVQKIKLTRKKNFSEPTLIPLCSKEKLTPAYVMTKLEAEQRYGGEIIDKRVFGLRIIVTSVENPK